MKTNRLLILAAALLCAVIVVSQSTPVLASETVPDGLVYEIADDAVTITDYTGTATELVIPEYIEGYPVTAIGANAFDGCTTLASITLPKTLKTTGARSFYCRNLDAVHITDLEAWCQISFNGAWSNPLSYGNNLYINGELVKQLVLPDTLTSLGGAFPNCTSILSVYIPDSITSIAAYAFDGCSNLQHVLCEGQWSNISVGTRNAALLNAVRHENASADALSLNSGCVVNRYQCSICEAEILDVKAVPTHDYVDDVCTKCGAYIGWEYAVADGAVKITGYSGTETHVTIPDQIEGVPVTSIVDIDNDYLISVTIPASITKISDTPFYSCFNLKATWVDENNPNFSSDSYGVLFNKDKTQLLEYPNALTGHYDIPETVTSIAESAFYHANLTSVTIPEGVTTLENCVFCCADITSVTIPASVTAIGEYAFNLCMSLTDVYYAGTCAQWESITIADYNDPLLTAAVDFNHLYSDWVITKQPTLTALGQREKTCTGCGDVVSEELPKAEGKVDSWNVSLSDDLVVTFRMNITPSIESTARVRIYVGNDAVTYRAANMEKTEDGLYIASVNIAAAQMSDYIFVTVLNGSDIADTAAYTVRQYADTLLADDSYSQYHALIKEMLNYGAAAQDYFDYNEDVLANEGITDAGTAEVPDSVDEELSVSGSAEGVSFYAASLLYRDKITVRYYFRFVGDINDCTFTANGIVCKPQLKDGLYYVEVADIMPENLDLQVQLTVTDGNGSTLSVSYSPMNYIVRMSEKGSDSLKALLQALYNYHLAAKELRAAA